jgi:hypothetical protein
METEMKLICKSNSRWLVMYLWSDMGLDFFAYRYFGNILSSYRRIEEDIREQLEVMLSRSLGMD